MYKLVLFHCFFPCLCESTLILLEGMLRKGTFLDPVRETHGMQPKDQVSWKVHAPGQGGS